MIFEAGKLVGKLRGHAGAGGGGGYLTDGTLLHGDGGGVDKPHAVDDAAARTEGHAEHLQTCANGKDRGVLRRRAGKPAVGNQMLGGKDLCGVFTAADAVEVEGIRHGFAELDRMNRGINAAHAGALAQNQGVAVVAVGAEDIGQDESDIQGAHEFCSSLFLSFAAAPVVSVASALAVFAALTSCASAFFRSRKAV